MDWLGNTLGPLAGWLQGWLTSPWLFLAGSLLVSVPILIHLLSKRRFKSVDWAAMDFLLEADRRNRRRVRLENLLLLLMRCLAVLLIALFVARPFLTRSLAGKMFESVRYERIVVLDDSLSMQAVSDGQSSFEHARRWLRQFTHGLATDETDDSLTLLLTSRPEQPVLAGVHLNEDMAAEVAQQWKALAAGEHHRGLEAALLEVEQSLSSTAGEINRVVYIVSDLRRSDWQPASSPGENNSLLAALGRIAANAASVYLVDSAGEQTANLVVSEIAPQEKALVAGVAAGFDIVVENCGPRDVVDVPVRFVAGESLPLESTIERIPAGESATARFTFTFARPEMQDAQPSFDPVPVRAELPLDVRSGEDALVADNLRYHAARVVEGIKTLVVDGDPSADYGRAESFYLERALAPHGEYLSGIAVRVATDVEFETLSLDDYQVVFLCNLYRISEGRRAALEAWVSRGGGLVIMPGDQIDEELYNRELFRDGQGLMPVRLDGIEGDESQNTWVFFTIEVPNHPVLRVFEGENNPLLEAVKVFRRWRSSLAESPEARAGVTVSARFASAEASPAVAEKTFGDGRVLTILTPADADWSNWPQDAPSYVITMQEVVRYLARASVSDGEIAVGEPIRFRFDLAKYHRDVELRGPKGDQQALQPAPIDDATQETIWSVQHDDTRQRGFYTLKLTDSDGATEQVLFAANVNPEEGNLERVDFAALTPALDEAGVRMVSGESLASVGTGDVKGEWWRTVVGTLLILLCGEQLLGWWFGRRR